MNRRLVPIPIAATVFALDRATKLWIERTVEEWQNFTVIPGFFRHRACEESGRRVRNVRREHP